MPRTRIEERGTPDAIRLIAVPEIDGKALARDRTGLNFESLARARVHDLLGVPVARMRIE